MFILLGHACVKFTRRVAVEPANLHPHDFPEVELSDELDLSGSTCHPQRDLNQMLSNIFFKYDNELSFDFWLLYFVLLVMYLIIKVWPLKQKKKKKEKKNNN